MDPKFKKLIKAVFTSFYPKGFVIAGITSWLIERDKINRQEAEERANIIYDTIKTLPESARNILVNVNNKTDLMRLFPDNFDYYV